MFKSTFFKIKEPKRFKYTPRFYDPRKEAFEARVSRIKGELGIIDPKPDNDSLSTDYAQRIRGTFHQSRTQTTTSSVFSLITSKRTRQIVRILSILLIGGIFYLAGVALDTIFYAKEYQKRTQDSLAPVIEPHIEEERFENVIILDE